MNKRQEKVLVATLCGLILTAAGGFAVQPAHAAGYGVEQAARVSGVARWDQLNVRKWPAPHSQQVGQLAPGARVWVERCIIAETGADWCLVETRRTKGWVNSNYLSPVRGRGFGSRF